VKPENQRNILFFLICFFCMTFAPVLAQEGYYFKQISINEGLTQSTVRCMLNDRRGFIWIGTRSGLNRYDRYDLKRYFYKKNDPASIPGNLINFLAEDKSGNIWIGTENGLALYDHHTDKFKTMTHQGKPLAVRAALDLPGGMVFGGPGVLYQYDATKQEIVQMATSGREKSSDIFTKMVPWKEDQVLLQTRRDGAWLFNIKDRSMRRATFIKEKELIDLDFALRARRKRIRQRW